MHTTRTRAPARTGTCWVPIVRVLTEGALDPREVGAGGCAQVDKGGARPGQRLDLGGAARLEPGVRGRVLRVQDDQLQRPPPLRLKPPPPQPARRSPTSRLQPRRRRAAREEERHALVVAALDAPLRVQRQRRYRCAFFFVLLILRSFRIIRRVQL